MDNVYLLNNEEINEDISGNEYTQNEENDIQVESHEVNTTLPESGPGPSQTSVRWSEEGPDEDVTQIYRYTSNVPVDKHNCNYLIFYLLGMTTLLPWNFFITAEDYWLYKFRNVTNPNSTDLTPIQKSFTSDLSISASIPGTICLIINAIIGHLLSLRLKMIGSLTGILIMFIITTALVEINSDDWQIGFFILTIVIVVIMNSFSAIFSGGLFGIAALFTSEYMTALVSGQALGGIFTALAMLISLTFGMDAKITAFVYFNIGNFVLLISIIMYIIMSNTEFFRYYVIVQEDKNSNISTTENIETLVENDNHEIPSFIIILKKIYLYAIAEFGVFAVTLSVYPAVTVLVQSQNHGSGHPWNNIYFVPVSNYLVFNSGDYLGRILAGIFEKPRNKPSIIVILTLFRIAFIPVIMLANMNSKDYFPIYIHSDIIFICIMGAFAITNGYLANISLIMAPRLVMHHEKEMASSIMAACLGFGLTTGSALSLILVQIL